MLGSKHIQFLLDKSLIKIHPSPILENLYLDGKKPFDAAASPGEPIPETLPNAKETMLLTEAQGKEIATVLEIPELYIELKRAVWQVERSIETQKEMSKEPPEVITSDEESKKGS